LKALAKLPADRFRSAAEFAGTLQAGASMGPTGTHTTMSRPAVAPSRGAMRLAPWVVAAAAIATAVWFSTRGRPGAAGAMTAAVIPLEVRTARDAPLNEVGVPFSISRDG